MEEPVAKEVAKVHTYWRHSTLALLPIQTAQNSVLISTARACFNAARISALPSSDKFTVLQVYNKTYQPLCQNSRP
jgi:hypothetical protein